LWNQHPEPIGSRSATPLLQFQHQAGRFHADGNVTQKTVDGTTTTYVYDYANRLTALGVLGATTTYGYDAFGQRVLQTGTTTTYLYPFKWYSVASSTGSGAKYATTTDYVLNGDNLVATVDQQTASGNATGTAKTRYVHPDHLGSTNVVTDENDTVTQTLDYFPYGSLRVSVSTSTNEQRKFIGQFADQSNLDYLNARYYSSDRGQFMTQDPVFWEIGQSQDGKDALANPQSLNSYSYANDNPISYKDPNGRFLPLLLAAAEFGIEAYGAWSLGYSGGHVLSTNLFFQNDYSTSEKTDSWFSFGEHSVAAIGGPFTKVPYEAR
jgi:RHS repeat-associated protein